MSRSLTSTTIGQLSFKVLQAISDCAQYPSVTITAPSGWKILGGGGFVNWNGPCVAPPAAGNLLTGVYPSEDGTTWTASSKDHITFSPAYIVAYCIIAQMEDGSPIPDSAYTIVSITTSEKTSHPGLTVLLPDGFTVVGGGARSNYTSTGSMLHATYPTGGRDGWVGGAKDHVEPDPSTITVWAIGLRQSFLSEAEMAVRIFQNTSPPAPHPRVVVEVDHDGEYQITGGGARALWEVDPSSVGSLLTGTHLGQNNRTWVADAKDHLEHNPCTITAWAIALCKV